LQGKEDLYLRKGFAGDDVTQQNLQDYLDKPFVITDRHEDFRIPSFVWKVFHEYHYRIEEQKRGDKTCAYVDCKCKGNPLADPTKHIKCRKCQHVLHKSCAKALRDAQTAATAKAAKAAAGSTAGATPGTASASVHKKAKTDHSDSSSSPSDVLCSQCTTHK
jgi:hypothetical protein